MNRSMRCTPHWQLKLVAVMLPAIILTAIAISGAYAQPVSRGQLTVSVNSPGALSEDQGYINIALSVRSATAAPQQAVSIVVSHCNRYDKCRSSWCIARAISMV